jgi:uncharacterized repeat protein (TIGR04042 family)
MPEMYFRLRWPDFAETNHYSPSLIIKEYFVLGQELEMLVFLESIRMALTIASDRVQARYGFACSRARDSLTEIERKAVQFLSQPDARISVLEFSS